MVYRTSFLERCSGLGLMDLFLEVTQIGSLVNQITEQLQQTLLWVRYELRDRIK